MKKLLAIKIKWVFFLIFVAFVDLSIAYAQDPIVYVRCERTIEPFELTGLATIGGVETPVTRQMYGIDIYDVLPDVTNFFTGFSAPCDLMYRDKDGIEKILFNCSSISTLGGDACAAMDPAISFDGLSVAFSVFRGTLFQKSVGVDARVFDPSAKLIDGKSTGNRLLPNKFLRTEGAHLHIVQIETGDVSAMPYKPGIYDTGLAFLTNDRVAFTSNRDEHTTTLVWKTTTSKIGTRIWAINTDGSGLDLSSHHSLSQEQHPYLLKDGRLAYSSWQIFGGITFRTIHSTDVSNSASTIDNFFNIYTQAADGAGNFPFYGQHSGHRAISADPLFAEDHNAAHFLTQTRDERVWFADYYRENNNGLGIVVGVMSEPPGLEGKDPTKEVSADFFIPNNIINFAPWAHNADRVSDHVVSDAANERLGDGARFGDPILNINYIDPLPFFGKVGHPAALTTDPGLMVAWGKGPCSIVMKSDIFVSLGFTVPDLTNGNGLGAEMNMITHLHELAGVDTPGCDVGLYQATVIPSQHPNDLIPIVDTPEWHEFMGRAAVPYVDIHEIGQPPIAKRADIKARESMSAHHASLLETGTPFGLLGAASITDRETAPAEGIKFAGGHQFNLQGTDTIEYNDEDLCGVRMLGIMPNRGKNSTVENVRNVAGERVAILGELSVLNRDASGARITITPDLSVHEFDTSFLVRFPANTPYMMQGIDCDGRTLNTDQTWQHLRPGEMKTCGGCHVHSRATLANFNETYASTPSYDVPRLGEGRVPLLAGKNITGEVMTRSLPGYGLQIDFARDILPIFSKRCASCHSGDSPAAGLALDRPGIAEFSTWWCLVADAGQTCVLNPTQNGSEGGGFELGRPQLTRYVRAFNSLGSLLYWKAANERTDRRTDADADFLIKFGDPHPTEITPAELGLLSRWIDLGASGGPIKIGDPGELRDTQKPTLHVAMPQNNTSELRIGTVDLGSGINVNSLVVCVVKRWEACIAGTNNIPGVIAEKHGVTTVLLGAPLDPDYEVVARVQDIAKNETEVRRSFNWLTQ